MGILRKRLTVLKLDKLVTEAAKLIKPLMIDKSSLMAKAKIEGGASGDSFGFTTVATGIPTLRESLNKAIEVSVGGKTHFISEKLYLERTTQSLAVSPDYLIEVAARNGNSKMVFSDPVIMSSSVDPVVVIGANLVKQGYK